MDQAKRNASGQNLYSFTDLGELDRIETTLERDGAGKLNLRCRRVSAEGEEAVCLSDLGGREERCLSFARAVAESRTHPRMLAELWEEFEA